MISVKGVSIVNMEDKAEEILLNEKSKLILRVIQHQHERLVSEINSGISQEGLETELRLGLKVFEENYKELLKLKNEEK